MALDPLSPIAPARVKALVVPIGHIKKSRFAHFVERLSREDVVHLRDVTPDGRPNRNMFSPLAFPGGAMFYDLTTHAPPPSHLALSPFDLYREPLAVLGVADGAELESTVMGKRHSGSGRTVAERNIRGLDQELEDLRDAYSKALVHRILIFDYEAPADNPIPIPEGLATIPPAEQHKRTTMKTVMCDISSLVLAEMTGLAKSYEAMSSIDSPGQSSMSLWQLNGSAWTEDGTSSGGGSSNNLARRNSQFALPTTGTRSASASGGDRSQVRMSMPPSFRGAPGFGSGSSTPARPSTPVRSGLANPPTTFDDIWSGREEGGASRGQPSPSRPGTAEGFRVPSQGPAQTQGKVPMQGFGSGGPNDKWRHKGKSRVQIVTGSLYLQAGRWSDSIRELAEAATVAKSVNDHVWHGKALELLLVNLLLLAWAGIEFQVPVILLPPQDKASSTTVSAQEAEGRDPEQPRWLRNLQVIVPDLLERIGGLYTRISSENLPPLPLSESTIRSCKILAALYVADGQLCKQSLETMVRGTAGPPLPPSSSCPRFAVTPSRSQIAATLLRAFPSSTPELLTTTDRVVILGGIVSVLGVLGLERKKAMVLRELVSVLVGGLVEARTRGAAEAGIHPAAGLVAAGASGSRANGRPLQLEEGDVEQGLDAFLGMLLRTYGAVGYDPGATEPDTNTGADADKGESATLDRIRRQSAARCFGMRSVKLDVLRACIHFSEALPDLAGVLRFSSDLLRTAGSGIAPGPRREDPSPVISREEQVQLLANISRTSSLALRLGLTGLAADYWDEFLVRGVELEPAPAARTPIPRPKSVLPEATATARASQDVNPFIYNPFLKQPDKAATHHILVAGEPATFRLTLQNPYEVDVEIDKITLDARGVDFESSAESIVLGSYRTQALRISGTARNAGTLTLTGATIRVRGCRERSFSIFSQPWAPEADVKIKAIGLAANNSSSSITSTTSGRRWPKPDHLELTVIPAQPAVAVKSCSLPQSSVMILEGERQSFSVTLQNLSPSTPADFLLFSFRDSTQEPLQAGLNSRDATSAELYEYELVLAKKQALRLRDAGDKTRRFIAPGQTASFELEILGKPGLTNGLVQVDYAHIGAFQADESFYTRQASLELTVTVNASVEVPRIDILPVHGSIPAPLWARTTSSGGSGQHHEDGSKIGDDQHFLLVLDLRNAWPGDMAVRLGVDDGSGVGVEERILPGNTSRVVLPLRRVLVEEPHAFIPALNPSRQRQFVVSTKISPDAERANREAFWYRERILDILRGSWETTSASGSTTRSGSIDFRGMRLTPRMIEALKVDEVEIEVWVRQGGSSNNDNCKKDQVHGTTLFVDEFAELGVRVTNRTAQPIYPVLRVVPALRHRAPNVALDFTRKFAFSGALQRALPLLRPRSSVESRLAVAALCRGEFDVTASVEEARLWAPVTDEDRRRADEAAAARPRSNTETMMDAVLGAKERRIWHSRRPCHVVVRDRE